MLKIIKANIKDYSLNDLEKLNEQNQKYVQKIGNKQRKMQSLVGRLLLESLYFEMFKKQMGEIIIEKNGRPYFSESGVFFSITHCEKMVVVALSDKKVGIDIDNCNNFDDYIKERVLDGENLKKYGKLPKGERNKFLCLNWCAKESYIKCFQDGSILSLNKLKMTQENATYFVNGELIEVETMGDYLLAVAH